MKEIDKLEALKMEKAFKIRNYALTDEEYNRLSTSGKKSYRFDDLVELFANTLSKTDETAEFYTAFKDIVSDVLEDVDINKNIQFLNYTEEKKARESAAGQSTIFEFMN